MRMIKFYYSLAPNPMKVALCLEEMGLPYEPIPVDTRKGEQFSASFSALNPNNKVPYIVDGDATVFDSNAILLYLGEKSGKFMPTNNSRSRGEMLSWLMFVASGVGPFSGQAVHFSRFAPEPKEYAVTRYMFEAKRHYGVVDARLAQHKFMLGDSYTIVDMALWGWARLVPFVLGDDALECPQRPRFLIEHGDSFHCLTLRRNELATHHASAPRLVLHRTGWNVLWLRGTKQA